MAKGDGCRETLFDISGYGWGVSFLVIALVGYLRGLRWDHAAVTAGVGAGLILFTALMGYLREAARRHHSPEL